MRTPVIARVALLCGLAGAAWGVLSAIDAEAAWADDRPAATATQQPGGLLDAVGGVVDQVLPKPSAEPTKDPKPEQEAGEEPEHSEDPAPADETDTEPRHGTDEADEVPADGAEHDEEPTTPSNPIGDILDGVTDAVEPVTEPVVDVVEVVTAPLPPTPVVVIPTPAPATPPASTGTTAPLDNRAADTEPATETEQAPAADVSDAAPADPGLPVLIGPLPGRGTQITDDGIRPAETADTGVDAAPVCDGSDRTAGYVRGDGKQRQAADGATDDGADQPLPARPCTPPAGPNGPTIGMAVATAAGGQLGEQQFGDTPDALALPALQRLTVLRGRSAIPVGQSTHLDPRPA